VTAGFTPVVVEIPDGEEHKTLATLGTIFDALLRAGIERRTPLVALGGGVVGDVTGFAAATLLRGLPVVQVPTTLLAQVDAAIGGKTAIDHPVGKNLIGAFHQPRLVLADVGTLATLPTRELLAGLAEVVKYGVIGDAALFAALERDPDAVRTGDPERLVSIVAACARQKAAVVAADELEERGERATLNFGHTVGHALEAVTQYGRFLHGEAVAIGMVAAARVSAALGVCDASIGARIERVLGRLGLPVAVPADVPPATLAGAMRRTRNRPTGAFVSSPWSKSVACGWCRSRRRHRGSSLTRAGVGVGGAGRRGEDMNNRWKRLRAALAASVLMAAGTANAGVPSDGLSLRAVGLFEAESSSGGSTCTVPDSTNGILLNSDQIGLWTTDGVATTGYPLTACGGWMELQNVMTAQGSASTASTSGCASRAPAASVSSCRRATASRPRAEPAEQHDLRGRASLPVRHRSGLRQHRVGRAVDRVREPLSDGRRPGHRLPARAVRRPPGERVHVVPAGHPDDRVGHHGQRPEAQVELDQVHADVAALLRQRSRRRCRAVRPERPRPVRCWHLRSGEGTCKADASIFCTTDADCQGRCLQEGDPNECSCLFGG
jgi:3-dehydroquinate synthase